MKKVVEEKWIKGNYYAIYYDDALSHRINVYRDSVLLNEYKYIFIILSDGSIEQNIFKFINVYYRDLNENVREQIASALKLLYVFKELKMKSLEEFDVIDIKQLSDFILGINYEGSTSSYFFKERRSNKTHNLYFGHIRRYFSFLKIDNGNIENKSLVQIRKSGFGMLSHTKVVHTNRFDINKKILDNAYEPEAITNNDYHKIIKRIKKDNHILVNRNIIIIRLMYEYGLRIGEVLGLTLEDLLCDEKGLYGSLILRNRMSDKKYQHAKSCGNQFVSEKDKQTVIISKDMYEMIKRYISRINNPLRISDKCLNNYQLQAKATAFSEAENYYIFLNKNYTPLSSSGITKLIKRYFTECGISVDRDKKQLGVCHRFRHGTAKFILQNEAIAPTKEERLLRVKEYLRHKSLESTCVYTKPSKEENINNQLKIQKAINFGGLDE